NVSCSFFPLGGVSMIPSTSQPGSLPRQNQNARTTSPAIMPIGYAQGVKIIQSMASTTTDHRWQMEKIVAGRRRCGGPFERGGAPRVFAGDRAGLAAYGDVNEEKKDRDTHDCGADCRDQIQFTPAGLRQVGVDAAGHAMKSKYVHGKKSQIEADEKEPELPQSERSIQHSPGQFRKPVIQGAE